MKKRDIVLILLLASSICMGRSRPPVLDPATCPSPYDPNISQTALPMAWLPADVNVSVVSQINVWNRTGREVLVTMEEVVIAPDGTNTIRPLQGTILPDSEAPIPDPDGGYNRSWTWGFTPTEARIYYILFTARTPSKPNWGIDQRVMLVYVEPEDVPVLWVQDVPILTIRHAQRLWQAAQKTHPMTKPTLVRLAKR